MIEIKQEGDFIWIEEKKFNVERIDYMKELVETIDSELIDFAMTFQDIISAVDVTPTHTNIYLNLIEAFERLEEFDEQTDDDVQYSLKLLFYKKRCDAHGLGCRGHD